jgi:hypothetical protein
MAALHRCVIKAFGINVISGGNRRGVKVLLTVVDIAALIAGPAGYGGEDVW